MLGPNGAGKTSTVEILEGYRTRSSGSVSVLGHDPQTRSRELRRRVGIVLQSSGIYSQVRVAEVVAHFAGFYPRPRDVDEVIALVGLTEKRDERARRLSGGQRRRLDLALALIGDPELIFLDEPTTGFDPAARRTAWQTIRSLKDLGKTVLLTTHYLDEAQELADRVAIIKGGQILAEGSPAQLGVGGGSRYRVAYLRDGEPVVAQTDDPTRLLHELTGEALAAGGTLEGLSVTRPSLEEIYLELTADA
jgi:ABC-2 type transport system ATP-binding protein